jgi:hypothetical protein
MTPCENGGCKDGPLGFPCRRGMALAPAGRATGRARRQLHQNLPARLIRRMAQQPVSGLAAELGIDQHSGRDPSRLGKLARRLDRLLLHPQRL